MLGCWTTISVVAFALITTARSLHGQASTERSIAVSPELTAEAQVLGREYLKEYFTTCGDSIFFWAPGIEANQDSGMRVGLVRARRFRFVANATLLSPFEIEREIRWSGTVTLIADQFRIWSDGRWTPAVPNWSTPSSDDELYRLLPRLGEFYKLDAQHVRGEWFLRGLRFNQNSDWRRMMLPCSEMPL